ncbi:MAG TPA: hypothetical protein PLQ29_06695 [Spirochaetales bacterium]|nr:hypothetical protein [Spirochaetales bacterium]HPM73362.1 hypothetical protein [Spirochaetales bacterium]
MIRVKTLPLAIAVVAVMFGGVALSKAVGYWNTTSTKEPAKFKNGELAGLPNPADIRGSYTWLDLEKAFGVPAAESARAFSTADRALDPAERVSVLEELYLPILPPGLEIGTGAVRLFVSLYTGLPLEAEEGSVLPDGALELLSQRPGMDDEALGRYVIPSNAPAAPAPAAPVPAAASPAASQSGTSQAGTGSGQATARSIVGKTTFGDLYDWGLTEDQVAAAIGYAPGPRSQSVRDSATANGKEFSELKIALQALVDAKP